MTKKSPRKPNARASSRAGTEREVPTADAPAERSRANIPTAEKPVASVRPRAAAAKPASPSSSPKAASGRPASPPRAKSVARAATAKPEAGAGKSASAGEAKRGGTSSAGSGAAPSGNALSAKSRARVARGKRAASGSAIRRAKYAVGQVVKHRIYPFRGVIFDIDPVFNNTEEWWQSIPEEIRPVKDQPYYHLLAENAETEYIAYVSEQNLLPDDTREPLRHPKIGELFTEDEDGRYQPIFLQSH